MGFLNGNLFGNMTTAELQAPAEKVLPKSRFDRAVLSLSWFDVPPNGHGVVDWYFCPVAAEDAVAALGWWNPVMNGRPKQCAQMLLSGIPSPTPGKAFRWKLAGLVYYTPPVIGARCSRNRTTMAGLALLKHWAENFPAFAKFFDAYYSEKAEREIVLDCVDFQLGTVPSRFVATTERNNILRKRLEEEKRRHEMYLNDIQNLQAMQQHNQLHNLAPQLTPQLTMNPTATQTQNQLAARAQAQAAVQMSPDLNAMQAIAHQMQEYQRQMAVANRQVQPGSLWSGWSGKSVI